MIKSLLIKNFILIDELALTFENGFNVLLGETGSGKSIIIKAIDTALGAKTSKDVLKDNSKHALIEITFENNGEETVISREISNTGTKCRLNGALVSLDEIKENKEKLIDIHSQFQTYSYIQQKNHIELLDTYIKSKDNNYGALLNKQETEFKRYTEVSLKLANLKQNLSSNADRIEFLKFQIDEIETADIKENEEDDLNKELEVLSNVQELKELSYGSYWALGGEEGSITEALGKIGYNISRLTEFDKNSKELEENFFNALETLRDVQNELRNYSESLQDDPERLDYINERLELIEKLKRKYGANILETFEKLQNELNELENSNVSLDELEVEQSELEQSLDKNSILISEARIKYAEELSLKITEELKKLEFDCPQFMIETKDAKMDSKGRDYVEFLITTNNAKSLAPLVKTASGGEISRVMLAMKTIFANVDKISTIIFDEIDTGISGKTSVSVANEIYELSKTTQVFAITHQPIIASKANSAHLITKMQNENDTTVSAKKLDNEGKIKALAQMSSGVIDEKSISFAKELILNASIQ